MIAALFVSAIEARAADTATTHRTAFSFSFFHSYQPPDDAPFRSVTGFIGLRIGHEFEIFRQAYAIDVGLDLSSNTWTEFATPEVAKRGISVYLSAARVIALRTEDEDYPISLYPGIRISYSHYWADFYRYDQGVTRDDRIASQRLVGSASRHAAQLGPDLAAKLRLPVLPVDLEVGYAPALLALTNNTLQFRFTQMVEVLLVF